MDTNFDFWKPYTHQNPLRIYNLYSLNVQNFGWIIYQNGFSNATTVWHFTFGPFCQQLSRTGGTGHQHHPSEARTAAFVLIWGPVRETGFDLIRTRVGVSWKTFLDMLLRRNIGCQYPTDSGSLVATMPVLRSMFWCVSAFNFVVWSTDQLAPPGAYHAAGAPMT